jgi:hypothetical protein
MVDVAGDRPEIAKLCRSRLDALERGRLESVRRARELKAIEGVAPESDEVREQLEALGYVE